MEVVELDKAEGRFNNFLIRMFQIAGILFGLLVAYQSITEGSYVVALISAISAVIAAYLVPLWWSIGNSLRLFTMPSMVVTKGGGETFSKKIFWLYGVQCTTVAIPTLFLISLPALYYQKNFENKSNTETYTAPIEQPAVSNSAPQIQSITTQPSAAPAEAAQPVASPAPVTVDLKEALKEDQNNNTSDRK